jgi:hypothetical protein
MLTLLVAQILYFVINFLKLLKDSSKFKEGKICYKIQQVKGYFHSTGWLLLHANTV